MLGLPKRLPSRDAFLLQSNLGARSWWLTTAFIQGKVFEQVIRDVCDASLIDFEEGGVGSAALEDLKSVGSFSCPSLRMPEHHEGAWSR